MGEMRIYDGTSLKIIDDDGELRSLAQLGVEHVLP